MTLKTENNKNFELSLIIDINYKNEYIEFLVILDNLHNNKREMKMFHGNEFKQALSQYRHWKNFIF